MALVIAVARAPATSETTTGSNTAITIAFTIFILLHVIASLALPKAVWGAHHLQFLPAIGAAVWCALLALVTLPPGRRFVGVVAGAVFRFANAHHKLAGLTGSAGALAFFVLLRSRNPFTGDGLLVASIVSDASQSGAGRAGFLVIALHKFVLALLRAVFPQADGIWAFALVSIVAGLGVLWLAWSITGDLFPARRSRALAFAALAASGGIALFFGHVEEYPIVHLAILAYIALVVRSLRRRAGIAFPTLALVAVFLAHPLGVFLAPSWIILALDALRRARPHARRDLSLAIVLLIMGAVALAARAQVVAESTYGGFSAFVPFVDPNAASAYTLFSPAHIAFLANEMLLVLGGALLLLALRLPASPSPSIEDVVTRRTQRLFLSVASAGLLLAVLVVDPKFGGRDWDLMALPLFPVILLLAHVALVDRSEPSRLAALLTAGAMVLHTLPWVWVNANRDRAVEMLLAVTANDPHYTKTGQTASRFLGRVLFDTGYRDEAGRLFEQAARQTQNGVDFRNFGVYLSQVGRYEEARPWLVRALDLRPDDGDALKHLGIVNLRLGRTQEAIRFLRSWLDVEPNNLEAHLLLGPVLADAGDIATGLRLCQRALELDAMSPNAWHMLGLVLRKAGRHEESQRAFAREAALRSSARASTE